MVRLANSERQSLKHKRIVLFALNGRGGMLHYTSQYANALLDCFEEVYVVLPSYSDRTLFHSNIKFIPIYAPATAFGSIVSIGSVIPHLRLITTVRALKPNVIQCMDDHPFYLFYLPFLTKTPLYVTLHDVTFHSGEEKAILALVDRTLHTYYFHHGVKLIVHGEKQKKDVQKMGVKESRIVVVSHGDYSFLTKFSNPQIVPEKYTLLFFGRIIKYKGVDTLIKSIPRVATTFPQLKVIIAGEGDFSLYKPLIHAEHQKYFEIINQYIPEKTIAELFQKCAFVVLPYDDATQSGIIPIAYAFKKPVITTNVGSLPEVVTHGKTGLIIEPKNPEALSLAIIKMFTMDLTKMGEFAEHTMQQQMDWKKIIKSIFGGD